MAEVYRKKTPIDHILDRPDTYIGSVEKHTQVLWVYDGGSMVNRQVSYVPGLYKIFDEILVNAADNKQRDPKMDSLCVDIDVDNGCISIFNNGDGIPVEFHPDEGVFVPELIFSHLLTSSNYDDSVRKLTGGRNGYGAKLTNIFSTEFVIETADGRRQKKYKQIFSENMRKKSKPQITNCEQGDNWTRVTFKPNLAKFNMTDLEVDAVALMRKRVVDMAGTLGKSVQVVLNGELVPVKSFSEYVDLYLRDNPQSDIPRIHEQVNDRWEICVSASEGQFQQVSFVNQIATLRGGTHVDYIANQVANYVMNIVNKQKKNANIKTQDVKSHLWVFVNALVESPSFDSQTKETLTTHQRSFGSVCELSVNFLENVGKSIIVSNLLAWADFKLKNALKKTDGSKKLRISGVAKLEDANLAGGKHSHLCTLILTEGDSAKALAMAGMTVVGRDCYGVFPLRGKPLNVRDATDEQILENEEINNIKKILGLQNEKEYQNTKDLRYGHLMLMTDQDHDGFHIKGLLINFIHFFWPSLLKVPGFLVDFITPIVKVTKGREAISFYSMPDYEEWKKGLGGNTSGWRVKYFKGLGTSTNEEGQEYFKHIDRLRKEFFWKDDQDGNHIDLAFSKKRISDRKEWLSNFEPGTYLDKNQRRINYTDFINKEMILFSLEDLQRSPSMVDGLKPSQRKILFCSFKRKFSKETRVAQFCGYVSEHSAYHHGEESLASTIIGMAQTFVGSNNINLLVPAGQFGTRNTGGKDAASARYIFTKLARISRSIFPKDDDALLDYLNEDGQKIEPTWYMPILPMVLVNGSEGIGTGWSTFIPNYNPRDVIANLRRLLKGERTEPMHPWYRGFKGSIEEIDTNEAGVKYITTGIIEAVNNTTLRITELPIRCWSEEYKLTLSSLKDNDKFIENYTMQGDPNSVYFEITINEQKMNEAKEEGLEKKLKLTTVIGTTNMHLFDSKGKIRKYDTPQQILEEFYHLRRAFYVKRKEAIEAKLVQEQKKLGNKIRFIQLVHDGEISVQSKHKVDLCKELQKLSFDGVPKQEGEVADVGIEDEEESQESPTENIGSEYDYLLSMSFGTMAMEKGNLITQLTDCRTALDKMRLAEPNSLWLTDLDLLEKELDVLDLMDAKDDERRKHRD